MSLTFIVGDEIMAVVTVRNLPDAVHRALRVRAAHHGRSTEAEIRDILEAAGASLSASSSVPCLYPSPAKRED